MDLYTAPRHRRALCARRLGMLRPLLAVIVLAAFVWLLLAAFGPAPAHAQGYDAKKAAVRKEMTRLLYKTEKCMNTASTAVLRQGVTTRAAVTKYTLAWCGLPLYAELKRTGWNDDDAGELVVSLADYSYDEAIRWGR